MKILNIVNSILAFLLAFIAIVLMCATYLCPILFIVFLILKLCMVIDWSWVLVCLPLIILVSILTLYLILGIFAYKDEK